MLKQLTRAKLLWLVALLILIVFVLYRCTGGDDAAPEYQTTVAGKGDVVARVSTSGSLQAVVTVDVGSQVSGRISELKVDFNTPVKKGQVIARIDPQMFQAAVEQARANQVAAQANYMKAKVQAEEAARQAARLRALRGEKLIAQADLDTAESNEAAAKAQIAAAEGSVAQARAALNQAQINLNYTTIISPIDGVVISRDTFFNKCWGLDHVPNSRTLDQHIAQLRKRIEVNPANPSIILTVHGVGYRYDE